MNDILNYKPVCKDRYYCINIFLILILLSKQSKTFNLSKNCESMSAKTKSLVFGYIRKHYRLYIPEVIIKICLLYFDPEIIIKFKGKDLQRFLEPQNDTFYKTKIKFNQNLAFIFSICPSFKREETGEYAMAQAMQGFITDCVDHYAICYKVFCVETQSIVGWCYRLRNEKNDNIANFMALTISECKIQQELTFKVVIHSLEIKYKNKIDRLFYPSLNARMLKEETSLNWNVDTKGFKHCAKGRKFLSDIMDNWRIECYPNGLADEVPEGLSIFIHLMSWPLAISKIIITIKSMIILNSEVVDEDEWEEEATFDDLRNRALYFCLLEGNVINLDQIENMTCNATINIKKLYDTDDVEIPAQEWKNHNVQISK